MFTQEDRNTIPTMLKGLYSRGSFFGDIRVTPIAVREKLKNLNPYKSQGPDQIPRTEDPERSKCC